jgi:nucleotide-binding universal stress UspA family protein
VPTEVTALPGTAAKALIGQAKNADLLVLGHRGRGGLRSAVLGSRGLHCVLHATCPVTIVRPEKAAAPRPDDARPVFAPIY